MDKIIIIKIGGRAAADKKALEELIREITLLKEYKIIMVHGGGAEVSRISRIFKLEPRFVNGIRMTSAEEMEVVDMVLAGKMNKYITRHMLACGRKAVGISAFDGGTVLGKPLLDDDGRESCTGQVSSTDSAFLEILLEKDFLPVISPVSMDKAGNPLNINADDVALGISTLFPGSCLVFLSDIPGILKNNQVIGNLNETEAQSEIAAGVIGGGMVPKVRASLGALKKGVASVVIGDYQIQGDLESLLKGEKGSALVL